MYCSRCGRELQKEMNFCPNCGMNINMQNKSENIEFQRLGQDSERNVILRNLDKAIPIYLNVEKMQAQLERLQMEKKNAETSGTTEVVCVGIYVIIVAVTFMLVMLYVSINMKEKMNRNDMGKILYIILSVSAAVVMVFYVLYSKHIKKKYRQKVSLFEAQLKAYINDNMCNEVFFLPEKYRYHFAACYICEYVANGRANNLPEALNLYEEQLHWWKMENMQEQLLRVRQKTVFVVM